MMESYVKLGVFWFFYSTALSCLQVSPAPLAAAGLLAGCDSLPRSWELALMLSHSIDLHEPLLFVLYGEGKY